MLEILTSVFDDGKFRDRENIFGKADIQPLYQNKAWDNLIKEMLLKIKLVENLLKVQ